jgi:uncharacterized SAM-binding protein YcdF (DUF218 family)
MNELENIDLHEHLVRKSVTVLLFKGTVVWLFYFFADWILNLWQNNREIISNDLFPQNQTFVFLDTASGSFYLDLAIKLFFGFFLLFIVLAWIYEYYIFKLDRIIIRKGIVFSSEEVLHIENIHQAEVLQGLLGKILDTGTLKLNYGARGIEKVLYLNHIPRPYHVAGHIKKN